MLTSVLFTSKRRQLGTFTFCICRHNKMATTNQDNSGKEPSTSTIPPEMIPLLAEIEASTEPGKFITLNVPIESEQKSTPEGDQPAENKTPEKEGSKKKFYSSTKSRQKRKKMEIYIRESKKFIYIGDQIQRWDQYRKELRVKNDEEFVKLLLDGFRKYTKVVQLVVGPTFGYPETVLGDDSSQGLHPLKKADGENMSDSDDLLDYVDAVKEGTSTSSKETHEDGDEIVIQVEEEKEEQEKKDE